MLYTINGLFYLHCFIKPYRLNSHEDCYFRNMVPTYNEHSTPNISSYPLLGISFSSLSTYLFTVTNSFDAYLLSEKLITSNFFNFFFNSSFSLFLNSFYFLISSIYLFNSTFFVLLSSYLSFFSFYCSLIYFSKL